MKLSSARNAAWLLPFLLTACFHRHHTVQNQQLPPALQQTEPTPAVSTAPVELPPSATTIPPQPTQNAQAPAERAPVRHHRHRRTAVAAKPTPEVAAAEPPPAVSAIGQLSSGDPVNYRQQTQEAIVAIEKGLNSIKHPLSAPEQKTADHIREFLKQARTALGSGDVDGAHTLAAKAKVLLAELTQ